MKQHRFLLIAASLLLIFEFGARLFFPAQETESTGLSLLRIVFDCGMIVAVVGISVQNLKAAARPIDAVGAWMFFPALGLLAGLGLFVLRLSGGLPAELPPRPESQNGAVPVRPEKAREPNISTPDPVTAMDALRERFETATSSYDEAFAPVTKTRWMQSDANVYEPESITSSEISDYRQAVQQVGLCADRVLEAMTAAEAGGLHVTPSARELWKVKRQICSDQDEQMRLLELHWTEWHSSGIKQHSTRLTGWQKEAVQLQDKLAANTQRESELEERVAEEEKQERARNR